MHGNLITSVKDPGPIIVDAYIAKWQKWFLIAPVAIFIALLGAYLTDNMKLFWQHYVIDTYFFLGFGLFGLIFAAIHHAANVTWSANVRRVAEGFWYFIFIAFGLIIILGLFGLDEVYDWTNPEIHNNFTAIKQAYLSKPGFFIKQFIFFGIAIFFGFKLVGLSLKQDKTGDAALSTSLNKWGIAFLLLFAYSFTIAVVDLLLSVNSQWFSTMFGVYCFAGIFVSGYALLGIVTCKQIDLGYLKDSVKDHHLQDLGTWTMGFSCFFVYVGFSQFMLIWYANLPAEVAYFMPRMQNGWQTVFVFIPLLKWIIPFVFLMPWRFRSNPRAFRVIGSFVLLGQWLDVYWMVMPGGETPVFTFWLEPLMFIGFAGLFGTAVLRFYTTHSVLAHKDPKLIHSLNGQHL